MASQSQRMLTEVIDTSQTNWSVSQVWNIFCTFFWGFPMILQPNPPPPPATLRFDFLNSQVLLRRMNSVMNKILKKEICLLWVIYQFPFTWIWKIWEGFIWGRGGEGEISICQNDSSFRLHSVVYYISDACNWANKLKKIIFQNFKLVFVT